MIVCRGHSVIAEALGEIVPVEYVERGAPVPMDGARYLFTQGLIHQKRVELQTFDELAETWHVNVASVMRDCEVLLENNPEARICVIGSESGFKGSFDTGYAAAKAGLHKYVETRRISYPGQQLVCVAPTCIIRSGMNLRRNADGVAALERRRAKHPKQRWLWPTEVAQMVHFLLCIDLGYTTNTVIRMNGGEHAT